jgi:pyruvate formate lyase activating enzyme
MKIAGVQKCTLIDFPNKIAAIIFTQGCNFRCPYCHNAKLWPCNESGTIDEEEVFNFLRNREGKLEGVVISGGEPLLQKDLLDFIRKIRRMDFSVKLDTNGSLPNALEDLIRENVLDFIAMDLKHVFSHYDEACGVKVPTKDIQRSVNLLKESGLPYELRMTVVPSVHHLDGIVESLREMIVGVPRFVVQNFVPNSAADPHLRQLHPFALKDLEDMRAALKSFVGECIIR